MTIQDILSKLKNLPTLGKIFSIIAIVVALVVYLFFTSSCGLTKAVVTNRADGTTTEIKITTNNPTSVTANPNVTLDLPLNTN